MVENAHKIKVVLLGESGVGKTSIINKYINNVFRSNFIPSSSSSFSTKIVDFSKEFGKSIKFDIWDTAGQEKYKSMNKIFYKDADVAILVYDITRKDSFESLKNTWLLELSERLKLSQVLVCFCANKLDMYEYQEVPDNLVMEFCEENDYLFKETSAKNGSGVDDMFFSIGLKLVNPEYSSQHQSEELKVEYKLKNVVNLTPKEDDRKKKKKCCK
mmetsp:Transcript_22983/g.23929  ORF Transcript_22983/g.23929 Transcript_22983/m.23929 type:complete len:215 (-) Transcript_22983:70-714(-)